jgi:hypothetical protein
MVVVMSMGVLIVVELAAATLLVVRDVLVGDKFAGSMGVQIAGHIVTLLLHVVTKLVEGRGTDQVALAIDLPGDRSVRGADFVVTARSGSGSSIVVDILSVIPINNPSSHQIGVKVRFVIDNGEDLALDTNGVGNILGFKSRDHLMRKLAEDTIVERSLVLVNFSAGTGGRMRPVDLVGFSDDHILAVPPVVFFGEGGFFRVVVVATESTTDFAEPAPALKLRGSGVSLRARSELVVLSDRVVLCTQMPVDIDGAHGALPVVLFVGDNIDLHFTNVSLGDVGASLRTSNMDAVNVCELEFLAVAFIISLAEDGGLTTRWWQCLQVIYGVIEALQASVDILEQGIRVIIFREDSASMYIVVLELEVR